MTLVTGFAESQASASRFGDAPVVEQARRTAQDCPMQGCWGQILTHTQVAKYSFVHLGHLSFWIPHLTP